MNAFTIISSSSSSSSVPAFANFLRSPPAPSPHRTIFTSFPRSLVRASSKQPQDMAGAAVDLSVHSMRNCKIVHLVRHAQGYHNVAGEKDYSAYVSYDYVDASVTPLGWKQVDELRKHLAHIDLTRRVELVVTSPLMRTMQTAVGAFGGPQYVEGNPSPPLMVANAGGSDRTAISSSGCPPIMAVELCREHMGVHPCDKRQSISIYRNIFPGIDFSEVELDEDTLWKPDIRETNEELIARGKTFLEWLSKRKEREIAVVSHSGFLTHTLSVFGQDCSAPIQKELRAGFNNCEMRTIILASHRELGDSISEDYTGGIPPCPDVPSDARDTEVIANGQ